MPSVPVGENTRLRGWSLFLARMAWAVLFTACLGAFIAGVPAHLSQLLTIRSLYHKDFRNDFRTVMV